MFASIEKEGENYARYPALDSAGSEDEDVDLDSILCSICGKEDEPNNDILFCDGLAISIAVYAKIHSIFNNSAMIGGGAVGLTTSFVWILRC